MVSRTTDEPQLHQDLRRLEGFLGVWEGEGEGHYPTIEPFRYRERVIFEHWGKPFLAYTQRTRSPRDGRPMHTESGYLRSAPGGAELLIAQPTGIVEVYEGPFEAGVLDLRATTVGRAATAKPVTSLRRRFQLAGDVLRYDLWMAHGDTPETHHLRAELHRASPQG